MLLALLREADQLTGIRFGSPGQAGELLGVGIGSLGEAGKLFLHRGAKGKHPLIDVALLFMSSDSLALIEKVMPDALRRMLGLRPGGHGLGHLYVCRHFICTQWAG